MWREEFNNFIKNTDESFLIFSRNFCFKSFSFSLILFLFLSRLFFFFLSLLFIKIIIVFKDSNELQNE